MSEQEPSPEDKKHSHVTRFVLVVVALVIWLVLWLMRRE
jgi:hypothetical protein